MRLLITIGTRPEAIKMAPLIKRLKLVKGIETKLCNTGQHKDLLDPILDFFNLDVHYNLNAMVHNQGLAGLTNSILLSMPKVFESYNPDYVLVHGDTTTSFATSLSSFYSGIKIAHIEAGLRTFDKYAPFPEEMNRSLTGRLADVHFAPTSTAKANLLLEGISKNVIITGNTVIDALYDAIELVDENHQEIVSLKNLIDFDKKIILFTGHRRENFGNGFDSVFKTINELTESRDDIVIVYPVHPNPNVRNSAESFFKGNKSVHLIAPLSYGSFIWLLKKSFLVLTDSGGIQEEAPSIGKPVLVLREVTERPEAVKAGTVILVGTNTEKLKNTTNLLLDDPIFYSKMTSINNPYGDGKASERIINYFKSLL